MKYISFNVEMIGRRPEYKRLINSYLAGLIPNDCVDATPMTVQSV